MKFNAATIEYLSRFNTSIPHPTLEQVEQYLSQTFEQDPNIQVIKIWIEEQDGSGFFDVDYEGSTIKETVFTTSVELYAYARALFDCLFPEQSRPIAGVGLDLFFERRENEIHLQLEGWHYELHKEADINFGS